MVPLKVRVTANVPDPAGLARVTNWVALTVPWAVFGKLSAVGVRVFTRPVRATLLAAPFKVRFSAAVYVPAAVPAVVWNVTPIAQLAPTASGEVQLFDAIVKSPGLLPTIGPIVTGSVVLPVFLTVTLCAALVTPGPCAAKVRLEGERVSDVALLTVPFNVDASVPAESVTDNVAATEPARAPAGGLNCTVTMQGSEVGAKVV